jgi:hypothetical protein
MATDYAIPLQKTHILSFEPRQVCYPWHRWYGLTILTRRAGGAHAELAYFCKLPEAPLDAMLVEVPKWMFDAYCATMRLVDDPHVDCATLRALRNTIAEQSLSVKTAVLQPQLTRQAGDGDIDGSDSTGKSNNTVGAVRRTARSSTLGRSHRAVAERSTQTTGATTRKCSDQQSGSHLPTTRRAR